MKNATDMTKGPALPLLMRFAFPIMLTSVLQQLYSLCDGIIIGRFLGIEGFAAIGAAGFIAWLPQSMLMGLAHGYGAILSQMFGAGDADGFARLQKRTAYLSGLLALAASVLLIAFRENLLTLVNIPNELRSYAGDYLLLIYAGMVVYSLYNWAAAILFARGDSRTPLIALLASSAVNIALDIVLVYAIPLGVKGAAIATVTAHMVSFAICAAAIRLKRVDFPEPGVKKIDGSMYRVLRMGIPPMLRDGVIAVGGLYVQSVINTFGIAVMAGLTAAGKYFSIVSMLGGSLEGAVGTYSGQNSGAGKYDRIRHGIRAATLLSMAFAVFTIILTFAAAPHLIRLITGNSDAEALRMGVYALRCTAFLLPALHILFIFRAALMGMGDSVTPMLSGFAELGMRLFSVFVLPPYIGYTAACIADGLGWIGAALLLVGVYCIAIRKRGKLSA